MNGMDGWMKLKMTICQQQFGFNVQIVPVSEVNVQKDVKRIITITISPTTNRPTVENRKTDKIRSGLT